MAAQLDPEMNRRSDYLNYARKQINYLLGNNEKRISYVVGHTENFPKRPHHRSRSVYNVKQRRANSTVAGNVEITCNSFRGT